MPKRSIQSVQDLTNNDETQLVGMLVDERALGGKLREENRHLLSSQRPEIRELANKLSQLTLEERKMIMYEAGIDPVSIINQMAYNFYNAQKPNPKTGEMYYDAEVSAKIGVHLMKMSKLLEKEPEIIQPVYILNGGKAA